MKKILTGSIALMALSGAPLAQAEDAATIQAEIKQYEQSRDEALAEIAKLKAQLQKTRKEAKRQESRVQEIQTRLEASAE